MSAYSALPLRSEATVLKKGTPCVVSRMSTTSWTSSAWSRRNQLFSARRLCMFTSRTACALTTQGSGTPCMEVVTGP
ncbi:hypothetical protein SMICM17S_04533 [Streptomyces microflavus]